MAEPINPDFREESSTLGAPVEPKKSVRLAEKRKLREEFESFAFLDDEDVNFGSYNSYLKTSSSSRSRRSSAGSSRSESVSPPTKKAKLKTNTTSPNECEGKQHQPLNASSDPSKVQRILFTPLDESSTSSSLAMGITHKFKSTAVVKKEKDPFDFDEDTSDSVSSQHQQEPAAPSRIRRMFTPRQRALMAKQCGRQKQGNMEASDSGPVEIDLTLPPSSQEILAGLPEVESHNKGKFVNEKKRKYPVEKGRAFRHGKDSEFHDDEESESNDEVESESPEDRKRRYHQHYQENSGEPKLTFLSNDDGEYICFPVDYPLPFHPKNPPKPVIVKICGAPGCSKPKKYTCSKTKTPACSLECYKKNWELS